MRLTIFCKDDLGVLLQTLRVTLESNNTVGHLLHRIKAHDGLKGCPFQFDFLRLTSGAWLSSGNVLKDTLEPNERELEAVPRKCKIIIGKKEIVTATHQYFPRPEDLQDKSCDFLSCRVGSKMAVFSRVHGWAFCEDDTRKRGFDPPAPVRKEVKSMPPLPRILEDLQDQSCRAAKRSKGQKRPHSECKHIVSELYCSSSSN